jgi:hypothetical protein
MFFLVVAQQCQHKFCSNASHVQIVQQNALNGPIWQTCDLTNNMKFAGPLKHDVTETHVTQECVLSACRLLAHWFTAWHV